jgi:L-iditol 2-dehydrogenase
MSPDRLEVAKRLGAEETVEVSEGRDSASAVRECTPDGRGVDVAIEAVGLPETWEETLQMVRKGGEVTLFGGAPSGTSISVDTLLLHYSQLTIRGIFHHTPHTVRTAYELLASEAFEAEAYISGTESLENVLDALGRHGRQEGIKYEIRP